MSPSGLLPLEFTECQIDSPYFRENLRAHEKELDKTSAGIKNLIKNVSEILEAARALSRAQRALSQRLMNFRFETIGYSQTDDEINISNSLREFGKLISAIEDERDRMLERANEQFVRPLEHFRKDYIGAAKEGKKKFEKETAKFCKSQETHLSLSTKKTDAALQEADATLGMESRSFAQAAIHYVSLLQEVHERKKFDFVETLLGFMYSWLTFYHQGYEVAKDAKPYMTQLQQVVQRTRDNFHKNMLSQTEDLKKRMLNTKQDIGTLDKNYTRQGYLFVMEKKAFGTTTWAKNFCQYNKENRIFKMIPYNQVVGKITVTDTYKLVSCTKRPPSESAVDKRFCFDITVEDRERGGTGSLTLTLQALSEDDRRLWIDAMDGKVMSHINPAKPSTPEETSLDEAGFNFVTRCIQVLENRGLDDQGLYRLVGVSSKVSKLLSAGLDPRQFANLNLEDRVEWETKTITSALKTYFRNLPQPLMTFRFHQDFIVAAKRESRSLRVADVHRLIHSLPKANFKMLKILVTHLVKVAGRCDQNRMSVSNLGVCFGPTLLRPEEDSMAAIMDIKFCNIVVELLIEHHHQIFDTPPTDPSSSPPHPPAPVPQPQSRPPPPKAYRHQPSPSNPPQPIYPITRIASHPGIPAFASNTEQVQRTIVSTYNDGPQRPHPPPVPPPPTTANLSIDPVEATSRSGSSVNSRRITSPRASSVQSLNSPPPSNSQNDRRFSPDLRSAISDASRFMESSNAPIYRAKPLLVRNVAHSALDNATDGEGSLEEPNELVPASSAPRKTSHHHHHPRIEPPPESTQALTAINKSASVDVDPSSSSPSPRPLAADPPASSRSLHDLNLSIEVASSSSSSGDSLPSSRGSSKEPSHSPKNTTDLSWKGNPKSSVSYSYAPSYRSHDWTCLKAKPTGAMPLKRARTIYACVGENESELTFEPNQIITNVRQSDEPGWYEGTLNGQRGLVPKNYVELLP
ncbi:unnamed protein product [Cyprideis torosa]|uniref:Uncharacterized protein n=1 Tax=Cyprideis torosa TaxID=163714 RepID=A0A7R8ZH01_9CRUS|nr:unnamed protein product [Cyprideis torosa]CAG0882567.1 unnamed protein product [Cyprideis torosa]